MIGSQPDFHFPCESRWNGRKRDFRSTAKRHSPDSHSLSLCAVLGSLVFNCLAICSLGSMCAAHSVAGATLLL
eukprot:2291509-Amphidinium_carterae.1